MINASIETKDIQLQKSHLNIQVTWMDKHSSISIKLWIKADSMIANSLTKFEQILNARS